jgi:hypothetical protein
MMPIAILMMMLVLVMLAGFGDEVDKADEVVETLISKLVGLSSLELGQTVQILKQVKMLEQQLLPEWQVSELHQQTRLVSASTDL